MVVLGVLCMFFVSAFADCRSHPDGTCISPAVCTPPKLNYGLERPVQMRQQWDDSDGYCGALATMSIAMTYGMWISQDEVRKAAGGGGHGSEIYYANIDKAMDTLKLTHEDWDWRNEPQPQYKAFIKWMKSKLVAGHPLVWMILDKSLALRNGTKGGPSFSHIEPVFGVYSAKPFTDTTAYDDDVLVHGSDYCAGTHVEGPKLYRPFHTLYDTQRMEGNCRNAAGTIGQYPCIMEDQDLGFAITGYVEKNAKIPSIPLSLVVDRYDEPDFPWTSEQPCQLKGVLTIEGPLEVGKSYTILRWTGYKNVPTDGDYLNSKFDKKYTFKATGTTQKFTVPDTFISSGTTYFRCIPSQ